MRPVTILEDLRKRLKQPRQDRDQEKAKLIRTFLTRNKVKNAQEQIYSENKKRNRIIHQKYVVNGAMQKSGAKLIMRTKMMMCTAQIQLDSWMYYQV